MRIAALALVALVAAAGCGGSEQPAAPPAQTTATTETLTASAREAAPAIAGTTLDGEAITLDDFHGRPVLVNVWSSW